MYVNFFQKFSLSTHFKLFWEKLIDDFCIMLNKKGAIRMKKSVNVSKLCVAKVPFFNHLNDDEMLKIAQKSNHRHFKKGDTIFSDGDPLRSEEHTSELQSRGHLVCRLLLEKKNDNY